MSSAGAPAVSIESTYAFSICFLAALRAALRRSSGVSLFRRAARAQLLLESLTSTFRGANVLTKSAPLSA